MHFTKQSTRHIAIIMDGNGRWAARRGLPRIAGHERGADTLRRTIEAAVSLDVAHMTLYAFSSDNWKRPEAEVSALMMLFRQYLEREAERCAANGVRVSVIGRRDRLPKGIPQLIEHVENLTRDCDRLHVRLAVDYSARDTLVEAVRDCSERGDWSRAGIAAALPAPDVDLLIRTGGEQRLSDFLLWECAYAEFLFLDCMWPEFTAEDLQSAIGVFHSRQRRFGSLPAA